MDSPNHVNRAKPSDDELPEVVVDALRQADDMKLAVPPEVDRTILRDAHRHLESIPRMARRRRMFRTLAAVSSVCAVLLVVVALQTGEPPDRQLAQESAPFAAPADISPKDIDRNGSVDILDAFAIARQLESGHASHHWDFNQDGNLNEDDIRLVAMDAVML